MIPSIDAEIRALLGRVPVTINELSSLKPGDVLRLDVRPHSQGLILVEGVPKFLAKVGTTTNGKKGVQILSSVPHEAMS